MISLKDSNNIFLSQVRLYERFEFALRLFKVNANIGQYFQEILLQTPL